MIKENGFETAINEKQLSWNVEEAAYYLNEKLLSLLPGESWAGKKES